MLIFRPEQVSTASTLPVFTVQQAAERTGLSVHTLRYYERLGLISPVARESGSGHRRYSERDLLTIEFLKRLRATGMPICEMLEYVTLARAGDGTHPERREMLVKHRRRIEQQIGELEQTLALVSFKIDSYQSLNRGSADCLAEHSKKQGEV